MDLQSSPPKPILPALSGVVLVADDEVLLAQSGVPFLGNPIDVLDRDNPALGMQLSRLRRRRRPSEVVLDAWQGGDHGRSKVEGERPGEIDKLGLIDDRR